MAGSTRNCCIPSCNTTYLDNVTLHIFPHPDKEKDRFMKWINAVGSDLLLLDHHFIYRNRRICHNHFEERYLTWTRRLSAGAVPSLCIPGMQHAVLRDITNIDITASCNELGTASTSAEKVMQTVTGKQSSTNERQGKKFKDDKEVLSNILRKVTKQKEKYAVRLKKALNLSENITFQSMMKKFTTLAAIFMTMQFRELKKHKMGRRFTEKEKIMALSLYKQGPRLYRFLSKAFVLPSPMTLSRLIAQADLKAGINEKLFKVMKNKVKYFNADDRLCVLLFDEIAIAPHFAYNSRKDRISGFVTNGQTNERKIADHALVLMIRGISRNYKQPVVYTFGSGSTKKNELAVLIIDIIRKLHSIGLRVLATVCDQGASNVSCINHLIGETRAKYSREKKVLRRDIFEVDNEEVIPLYDPPHLIKGIRNNLLKKDLKCSIDGTSKTAKWGHLVLLQKEDPAFEGIRLLKKLTDDHVNPEKNKMKVKLATQVFSEKVASTMGYLADKKILPEECGQTASVLHFFDELFDSVNGSHDNSKKRRGKPLLGALTPNSPHNAVWARAKKTLSTMTFTQNGKEYKVPSVKNWLHTVNNMEYLRDVLFTKYSLKSIWMRHFNQDPLENFFGNIRSHGFRNINPTPEGFEIAFASLLISNLTGTHSRSYNCQQDTCSTMFKSMKELFQPTEVDSTSQNIDLSFIDLNIFMPFQEKERDPRIFALLQYVTGYVLKKTRSNVFTNCVSCKNSFYSKGEEYEYIRAREFNKNKQFLHYPTKNLIKMFSKMQDIAMYVLKNHCHCNNVRNYMKTIFYTEINTNFIQCQLHKKQNFDFICNLVSNFFTYNWCKDINNILSGRRKEAVSDGDTMKNLAIQYYNNRRKKIK